MRRSAITHREELGAPELIELLLHRKAPEYREEEQHPHLQHIGRQSPDEPADDAEAGEYTEDLAAIEFIASVHEYERRDDADGEIQCRQEQRHRVAEVADMLIDIRHKESVRAGSQVPERIDGAEHDDGLEARTMKDIAVAGFLDLYALGLQLFRTPVGFLPLRRLRHLQALIPYPGCDYDEMGKYDAVAQETEHRVQRYRGQEHDDRAEHPRNLRRAAVFRNSTKSKTGNSPEKILALKRIHQFVESFTTSLVIFEKAKACARRRQQNRSAIPYRTRICKCFIKP